MPRFRYWTILIGQSPTAFRSHDADGLLPTLKQLQRRQPDAVLRWFERGRIWSSPEEARAAFEAERRASERPARAKGWRPGGQHRDPRDRYKKPRQVRRAQFSARRRRGAPPGGKSGE